MPSRPVMSATPTLIFVAVFVGALVSMSLASRISALAVVSGSGQDQDRRNPPGVARAWVFRLCRRRSSCAHRTTWAGDPDGGGPLPRDLRRCHARRQLLLDGLARSSTNSGTQRIRHRDPAPTRRPLQYVDISCATTSASFDDSSGNQPYRCSLMAYAQAHLDALEAALVKGEKRGPLATRPSSTAASMNSRPPVAVKARPLRQAVDTGMGPARHARSGSPTSKGILNVNGDRMS